MKKTLFFILLLILSGNVIKAQNLIAVQHGNNATFYTNLDTAIVHAQNGDTIYLSGGFFSINNPINKRLYIIGVGYNPDSTISTFPTTLNGNLSLASGASNGFFIGFLINGSIIINDTVSFYTIIRCRITGGISMNHSYSNFIFNENIIEGGIYPYQSASNCSFLNNIISIVSYWSDSFFNSLFKNNIFLFYSYCNYNGCFYSIYGKYLMFENNIFVNTGNFGGISNSVAKNNLFVENISFPNGTNNGLNNIVNQAQSSIFVNQTGNSFDYTHDYHLKPTCPGKNAGTDGTDIGIYGGLYPWKDGSVPSNPHIINSNIGGTTNSNGALPVNIKVGAQER